MGAGTRNSHERDPVYVFLSTKCYIDAKGGCRSDRGMMDYLFINTSLDMKAYNFNEIFTKYDNKK